MFSNQKKKPMRSPIELLFLLDLPANGISRWLTDAMFPTLAPNEYEMPYALNEHPKTGIVWMTSNMSDRIFSFDPKNEQFTSYPLPTRVSYLRDIVFTEDGKVCSSNSNLPSYAIEGGLGGLICLDPDKNSNE